tara:strand:+ start:1415 stop:1627 length:213 start_codon:yes stop_codon:yes gene_type:complete
MGHVNKIDFELIRLAGEFDTWHHETFPLESMTLTQLAKQGFKINPVESASDHSDIKLMLEELKMLRFVAG